jgi:hypothetical protein
MVRIGYFCSECGEEVSDYCLQHPRAMIERGMIETIEVNDEADQKPHFSHIDAVDHDATYALDTAGRHYMLLWRDDDTISEEEARAIGAMPIVERFAGSDKHIPVDYLEAWTASAEPWSY